MRRYLVFGLLLSAIIAACANKVVVEEPTEAPAILWEGMGAHARKVTTKNTGAQQYFDQGLALCFGFNHDEAIHAFDAAARLDPDCAMAYWGKAYALGPNYNLAMDAAAGKRAHDAIQEALARTSSVTAIEKDLIDAMATRYQDPPPTERDDLDRAYAAAMAKLWAKYNNDGDIGFIYAESLLDLSPWNQWTKDGQPKANTLEVVKTLERVMELNENHAGANHMYIHVVEASQSPERGEAAADRLAALSPGIGHVVHMPSHIYMRVGRYKDSLEANVIASRVDRAYFKKRGMQGMYHIYHAHNNHFIVWSEMFRGRYESAIKACDVLMADLPESFYSNPAIADWFVTKLHVQIRFGKWEEVLRADSPRQDQPYAVALWHYARAVAFANTKRFDEARAEATEFKQWAAKVPQDQNVHVVPCRDVLSVARSMMHGEIAFKSGKREEAFEHLRAAVKAEDALRYTEPNPWMMPSRHALGALLLSDGQVKEAEACYRADLKRYPKNGWALRGLADCLKRRGADSEAEKVEQQFKEAWKDATVAISASCFCAEMETK